MAQLNAYNDYKTGTTAEEQSKLVETGRVVFSGKTTDNGDYQTKSVALSELMSTSSGGGGMTPGQPNSITYTFERDDGVEYCNVIINVNNNTFTSVNIDDIASAITAAYPPSKDDPLDALDFTIVVNSDKSSELINACVEILKGSTTWWWRAVLEVKDSAESNFRLIKNTPGEDANFWFYSRMGSGTSLTQIHILGNAYRIFDDNHEGIS